MGRGLFILVVVMSVWASEAAAQEAPRISLGQQLTLDSESREVTGLYVAGVSLFVTGAALGVGGGLTLIAGDSIGPGIILLPPAPLLAGLGIVLFSIAAGWDAGLASWRTAANDGRPEAISAARSELSSRIAWTYGIGAGIIVASGLAVVVMYAIDQTLDSYHRLQAGPYFIPVGTATIGMATMLAAAGMDIAAGAWSPFVPSISPLPEGGVMASGSGRF